MKKYSILCALLLILVLLVAGQAVAGPPFVEFHAVEYQCLVDYSGADLWEVGKTAHGRNATQYNYVTSDDEPRVVGPATVIFNYNVNLTTGKGVSWGTFNHDVPAYGGGWVGTWNGNLYITPVIGPFGTPIWLMDGRGVGHGQGAFAGMELRIELHQELYDPAVDGYDCGGFTPPAPFPLPVRSLNTSYIIENAGD